MALALLATGVSCSHPHGDEPEDLSIEMADDLNGDGIEETIVFVAKAASWGGDRGWFRLEKGGIISAVGVSAREVFNGLGFAD